MHSNAFVASTSFNHVGRDCHEVAMNIDELRFPDDFAEFKARADSGGSTYGLLRRQAFTQRSLRAGPTRLMTESSLHAGPTRLMTESSLHAGPTRLMTERDGDHGNENNCKSGQKTAARRSKSLVPPTPRSYIHGDCKDVGNVTDNLNALLVDPNVIFKTFCEKTQLQQQQQLKMDTLQVNGGHWKDYESSIERDLKHTMIYLQLSCNVLTGRCPSGRGLNRPAPRFFAYNVFHVILN